MATADPGKQGPPKAPPIKQTRFAEDEIRKPNEEKKPNFGAEMTNSRVNNEENSNTSPEKKSKKKEEVREIGEWDDRLKIAGDGDTHQANLKIEYDGFMTHQGFFNNVIAKIKETNDQINKLNPKIKGMPAVFPKLTAGLVFKYRVTLYGVSWWVYKTITHFEELEKDLRSFFTKLRKDERFPEGPPGIIDLKTDNENEWTRVPSDWHSIRNRLKSEKAAVKAETTPGVAGSTKSTPTVEETSGLKGDMKKDSLYYRVHLFAEALSEFTLTCAAQSETSTSKYREIIEFWGISKSFCKIQFQKVGEFAVKKYSQGRKNDSCPVRVFKQLVNFRQPRWLCVGTNNLWYYKSSTDEPAMMRDNVMIDQQCSVQILDLNPSKLKLELKMARRNIKIGIRDTMRGLIVLNSLTEAFQNSNYTKLHRFASFAPPRPLQQVHLYADAVDYYKDIFKLLSLAKDEIMIAGWMISPEVPFLRNDTTKVGDDTSLMALLKMAADRGVKVYVLVYKEVESTMYNDSEHCKSALEALNSNNIKVLRHPTSIGQSLFWSHHEKICIVDRKIVMMGGLDLAWGRWDTQSHDLFDYSVKNTCFPGVDYYNAFKKDFEKGRKYQASLITPQTPRMPWHDVAIRLTGPVVFDYLTHFVTYFNNSRELNNESQVLFSQLSLTNPKYSISNSIKELLKAKIGSETALQKLIEQKLGTKIPKATKNITLESDAKFSNQQRLEIKLEAPVPEDVVATESTALPTQEARDDIRGWIYMNSDEERQLNKEIDIVKKEETLYAQKYTDSVFKKLDYAYVKDIFLAPEDDPIMNYRQPIYNLGVVQPTGEAEVGPLMSVPAELNPSIIPGKNESSVPLKLEQFSVHLAALKEAVFSSSIGYVDIWFDKEYQIRYKYMPNTTSTKEETIRFSNPADKFGLGEEDIEDQSDMEIIPEEGAIKTSFKSFGRSKTSGGQGQIKISNNSFIQALRSASPWSIGLDQKETSIMNCYIETIENAKRYIYIENQFFISSVNESKSNEDVRNRLAKALYKRIKLAIDRREQFKVVVCMPLLPAFEADLQKKEGDVMLMQIALENMTIGYGKNSLFEKIKQHTDNPENYFMVCGLRRWQYPPHPTKLDTSGSDSHNHVHHKSTNPPAGHQLDEKIHKTFTRRAPDTDKVPQTELIYIHSKLLIADDCKLIMGSANFNDRSMWGSRDSELAVYIEGNQDFTYYVDKRKIGVNKQIFDFRVNLFMEHFGLSREEVAHVNSNKFWSKAWNTAHANTQIYEKVWHVIPSNQYRKWTDMDSRVDEKGNVKFNKDAFNALHQKIVGHAVVYPHDFLCEEGLINRLPPAFKRILY